MIGASFGVLFSLEAVNDVKLKPQHQDFADYYLQLGNAEQAAIKAGYSERYARGNAYKLVAHSGIRAYIEERLAKKDIKKIADQDEVLAFLTNVLRGEETERIPMFAKDHFEMVDNTPSIKDRTKAAELLGKRYTLWTDKQQIEGSIGVTIVDDIDE
jgi:phage terminase small subunit